MVSTAKVPAKAPAKVSAKPAAKRPAGALVKPARATPSSKEPALAPSVEPSLRFYHSKALRTRTNSVLDGLQARPEHPKHGEALADLVAELIEAGMDYYFLKALKQAKVGFVAEQSARLGMSGAVRLINSVSRNFIVRMDQAQLLVVASHIRSLAATV
ncbi:MAG: hypothetical protein KJ614_16720 [Gammaproteobacteria bacterium]|uniref:hypothetical protein n=1 Tax=Rhodoferax sp. TaxID=50421 RepID=UPI0017EEDC24|nr:hypothetical protein [Rhodoferax sp.]MBU3900538.1 hypothetical protein [Gammaproteobacteria bacterium]MBA3057557.1 hypothetical protein [Rhodoferax sp.]MBU3996443.1 hypothetical protein [Gammaproteobacteria bacterium]MBU4079983.1 hypothetical protein [Gammaproteobacteria bacterium]MBU4113439.1 hypothetical protein [Gammaproteobacteria bacterium]